MIILEAVLVFSFLAWIGFYWKLAWTKGTPSGPSYIKMFFSMLLFFGNSWPAGTEITRTKLQSSLFFIIVISVGLQYSGVV